MSDGGHVGKYWKCHNSPTSGSIQTKLGWSHPITFPTFPPWCGFHGNGRCNSALNTEQLWASGDLTHEPILMKVATPQHRRSLVLAFGGYGEREPIMGGLGAMPPAESRGRDPGQGVWWRSPPEAEHNYTFHKPIFAEFWCHFGEIKVSVNCWS